MDNGSYKKMIKKYTEDDDIWKNLLYGSVSGGVVCMLGEILCRIFSMFNIPRADAIVWVIIIMIMIASLLTCIGIFDDLVNKFRSGLIIPITGFAHSITSSILDYKNDGLVTGIGSNAFKLAGSVILYGVVGAFVLAIVKVIISV